MRNEGDITDIEKADEPSMRYYATGGPGELEGKESSTCKT